MEFSHHSTSYWGLQQGDDDAITKAKLPSTDSEDAGSSPCTVIADAPHPSPALLPSSSLAQQGKPPAPYALSGAAWPRRLVASVLRALGLAMIVAAFGLMGLQRLAGSSSSSSASAPAAAPHARVRRRCIDPMTCWTIQDAAPAQPQEAPRVRMGLLTRPGVLAARPQPAAAGREPGRTSPASRSGWLDERRSSTAPPASNVAYHRGALRMWRSSSVPADKCLDPMTCWRPTPPATPREGTDDGVGCIGWDAQITCWGGFSLMAEWLLLA